jgi:hypothetical protein
MLDLSHKKMIIWEKRSEKQDGRGETADGPSKLCAFNIQNFLLLAFNHRKLSFPHF